MPAMSSRWQRLFSLPHLAANLLAERCTSYLRVFDTDSSAAKVMGNGDGAVSVKVKLPVLVGIMKSWDTRGWRAFYPARCSAEQLAIATSSIHLQPKVAQRDVSQTGSPLMRGAENGQPKSGVLALKVKQIFQAPAVMSTHQTGDPSRDTLFPNSHSFILHISDHATQCVGGSMMP